MNLTRTLLHSLRLLLPLVLVAGPVVAAPAAKKRGAPKAEKAAAMSKADEALLGRWALTIPGGRAGWLEIRQEKGWLDGSILWGGGSVVPVSSVTIADGTVTVTRTREVERKDASGKVVRKQQLTDTITGQASGDTLSLTLISPSANGRGFTRSEFTGKRIPPLPPRPDLARVKFGAPVQLFDGRTLTGWRAIEADRQNAWVIEGGAMHNRPPADVPGQPHARTANIRTEREFEDFNLKLEVNVPAKSNSGVYLRGLYEVQVMDSYGRAPDSHNMGAIYSRLTPSVPAEKPAGEWQTLEMTLVDRHATVVLNGKVIIDNQPLLGCTGGAMFSDQSRPGPIMLQGDHGPVSYRNLVLRPVVK